MAEVKPEPIKRHYRCYECNAPMSFSWVPGNSVATVFHGNHSEELECNPNPQPGMEFIHGVQEFLDTIHEITKKTGSFWENAQLRCTVCGYSVVLGDNFSSREIYAYHKAPGLDYESVGVTRHLSSSGCYAELISHDSLYHWFGYNQLLGSDVLDLVCKYLHRMPGKDPLAYLVGGDDNDSNDQ
jgi:hypothetical protein